MSEGAMKAAMTDNSVRGPFRGRARGFAVLTLLVGFSACGLDKVEIPPLAGPSELGISVKLTASPDVLTADGISTALIQAEVRGPNGQPLAGKDIYFAISNGADSALFADIGSLSHNRGLTDGAGITQVVYRVPPRTDFTRNGSVLVDARPLGNDANGVVYRTVRIELRSAEPFLFPPSGSGLVAVITVEPPTGHFVGNQILFQGSGSTGHIIRYHWDFGDGTTDDKPDVNHAFGFSGVFKVTLVVTDDRGAQASTTATVTVN
jgi:hypothetical protein